MTQTNGTNPNEVSMKTVLVWFFLLLMVAVIADNMPSIIAAWHGNCPASMGS